MICKRCQSELKEGSRFCPACGALQPMICPECGAESRPGSKTCAGCGKKLPLVDRPDKLVYTRRPKRIGDLVASFAIAVGAVLLLGGAALLLFKTVDFTGKEKPPVSMETQVEEPEQTAELEVEEVPVEPVTEEEVPPAEETPAEETAGTPDQE